MKDLRSIYMKGGGALRGLWLVLTVTNFDIPKRHRQIFGFFGGRLQKTSFLFKSFFSKFMFKGLDIIQTVYFNTFQHPPPHTHTHFWKVPIWNHPNLDIWNNKSKEHERRYGYFCSYWPLCLHPQPGGGHSPGSPLWIQPSTQPCLSQSDNLKHN